LAGVFLAANVYAVGGSREIFRWGNLVAYDGLWFAAPDAAQKLSMKILFIVRLLDPVTLLLVAGAIVLWPGWHYPPSKKAIYNNMPKKLFFLGAAVLCFALSMLLVAAVTFIGHIPNQWWIYYVGALLAGVLETLSLQIPVRKDVQVSEHQKS